MSIVLKIYLEVSQIFLKTALGFDNNSPLSLKNRVRPYLLLSLLLDLIVL